MTVFTVGYADKTLSDLLKLMSAHKIALLIDVRSIPFSRKKEFNRLSLERALGKRYCWDGGRLGGLSGERCEGYDAGLQGLAEKGQTQNICVMCMEKNPDQCHRKRWIAADLKQQFGVVCIHL
jgi:ATP-dependent DNA helicase RecQ